MSAIVSLSRPGLCAGRLPLQLLISKLLRFGEHAAAASLPSLPLAYQRRVRWTLCGTSLTIEADGSRAACGALNEHGGRGRACLATLLSRRCEWSKEVA